MAGLKIKALLAQDSYWGLVLVSLDTAVEFFHSYGPYLSPSFRYTFSKLLSLVTLLSLLVLFLHPSFFFEESKLEAKNSPKKYGMKRFQTICSVKQLQSAVFVLSGTWKMIERREFSTACPTRATRPAVNLQHDCILAEMLPPLHGPCLCWALSRESEYHQIKPFLFFLTIHKGVVQS